MPAALPFPIGSRLYDWRYETDPEPHLNGRRVAHARGKVLGGSSSINGMIFQRGNPMDYERWAAQPGHEGVGLRPLPALLQADGDPAARRRHRRRRRVARWRRAARARAGPGRQPAVRRVLRGDAAGRLPPDRRRQRLPPGGVRAVRPQPAPRPPALGRARLPAPRPAPQEPRTSQTLALATKVRFDGKRAVGVDYLRAGRPTHRRRRRGDPLRRRDQHPAAAPALRCRRRAAPVALGVDVVHHLPGVGENLQDHLEVYIQYASKQPVSIAPGLQLAASAPRIGYQWLFHRRGLGATNHFEGGGFARSNDDVDYPNLMFHFLPVAIRYDGTLAHPGPRLPGAHRADVRRHPGPGPDQSRATRSSTRRCCSTTSRPPPTGASGSRRSGSPATSSTSRRSRRTTTASSPRARASRRTRRSSTGSAPTPRPRCTPRARPRWASRTWRSSTRRRCGCTASRGCASSTPRSSPSSPTATSTRP